MKKLYFKKTLNASTITSQTLVGHFFDEEKGLYPGGNCFSMIAEDKKEYRILNFGAENLYLLLTAGTVDFPIKIHPLSGKHAVVLDERIPNRFYWNDLCGACTPFELLPITQRIKKEMQFKRGHTKILEGGITLTNTGLIDGIDIEGNDYSMVKTEPVNFGTYDKIRENKKIRFQEMIQPFVEAHNKQKK